MHNQRGFIGVGVLIAIILGIVVLGGGAYYVVQQQAPMQTASDNFGNVQTLPTTNNQQQTQTTTNTPAATTPAQNPTPVFTSPKGDVFKVGSEYTISWSSSQKSNQTMVPLYFTDSMCGGVNLVNDGERGCSALKLATVPLGSGTFQLNLKRGSSVLSSASLNQNRQGSFVLFLETPQSRIVSSPFTIADNDFTINSAYSDKKLYAPGETVRFSVGGVTDTGESLTPELGFAASSWLEFDFKNNLDAQGSAKRIEGVFNQAKKQWDFVTTAPLVPKADYDYRIFVYIKCSNQNMCQQKYVSPLEKDDVVKFNVTSN